MIKGVVFDWGGVLVDNISFGVYSYCAKRFGVEIDAFKECFSKYKYSFYKGILSGEELWEKISKDLKIKKSNTSSLWAEAFKSSYVPKKEMFSLAKNLQKKGYKTGFLSNTEAPAMKFFKEQGYDMFDELVFSCAEGFRKPQQEIYQLMLVRLNLQPEETVFIDDKEENITGAERAGMKGIIFRNPQQVKKELVRLGIKV